MFDNICLWSPLVLNFCLCVCSYFLFHPASVLEGCTFLKYLFFSSRFCILLACSSLQWSLMSHCISVVSNVTSFTFLTLLIWTLSLFSFSLIGGQLLYNIVLFSGIHQHESAIGVHVSSLLNLPPTLSQPSRLSQNTRFRLPASYCKFPLAIYFTRGNMYV